MATTRPRRGALPLVLAMLAPAPVALAAQEPEDTPAFVEVSGTATVEVPADRARLRLSVVTEGTSAAAASAQNAARMTTVLESLRGTDLDGLVVETWGYSLQPRYGRDAENDGSPRIVGYEASNNVVATIDDVDGLGTLLDAAVRAGSNRVTAIEFEARDTEAAREEALRQAVAQAEREARIMADALGVPLGPPIEVRGGANPPDRPRMAQAEAFAMRAVQAPSTPVEAGSQTVRASVTVRYRLGGR